MEVHVSAASAWNTLFLLPALRLNRTPVSEGLSIIVFLLQCPYFLPHDAPLFLVRSSYLSQLVQ